jgi:Zn-dependent protease/predicted transcriptional regulator
VSGGGLPIGRLFGIEIRVSFAWAVLIAIVTLIGAQQASLASPGLSSALQWAIGGGVAVAFLVSVLAHELAHALTARRRGVPATVIVLGFVGGLAPLAIQAARPVDEAAIALSGPVLSIAVALAAAVLGAAIGTADPGLGAIAGGLVVVGVLNLILGVLSLLPGLPLDGGRIVRALAWARTGDADRATRITARVGRLVGWAAMGIGVAIAFMDLATEGLLVLSLGWFLSTGARTLDRRQGMELLLRGVPVREAMERDVPWVGPHLTIDTFANRYEGEDGVSALAVVDEDRVVGVLGIGRLKRLGRRRFAGTRVADIMATPPQAPVLSPDDELWGALDAINQSGLDGLAVAEDGHLAGMLTRRSLATVIRGRIAARDRAPA